MALVYHDLFTAVGTCWITSTSSMICAHRGMAPRRRSGDAKPLTPCPQYPGDRQGHPRRVQGMPSPWTLAPDLGHVTVEDQLEAKISSSSSSSSSSSKALQRSLRKNPGGREASKESQEISSSSKACCRKKPLHDILSDLRHRLLHVKSGHQAWCTCPDP